MLIESVSNRFVRIGENIMMSDSRPHTEIFNLMTGNKYGVSGSRVEEWVRKLIMAETKGDIDMGFIGRRDVVISLWGKSTSFGIPSEIDLPIVRDNTLLKLQQDYDEERYKKLSF